MLKAVVDLNRLLPAEVKPESQRIQALRGDPAFQYLIRSLQRRYLELAAFRQSTDRGDYEFCAGAAQGANEMLRRIDLVLADVSGGPDYGPGSEA